jgi:hypothetical protein
MLEHAGAAARTAPPALTAEYEMIRDQSVRFSDAKVAPSRPRCIYRDEQIPMETVAEMGELASSASPPEATAALDVEDGHVRRLRGALPRLHRRRLARHALRDRRPS